MVRSRMPGFAACALASCFWGCGFFFGKIALREMNVGAMVFYRFLVAALGISPLLWLRRPRFSPAEWRTLLLASLLGIPLQFLLQFKGLALTTVSHASLMVGTMPVILALGASVFARERLHAGGWIAIAVSATGAALIALGGQHASDGAQSSVRGDLLVVLSLCIALFWVLLNKRLMERHNHLAVTAWGLLAGALMLALYVPAAYGMPPVRGISLSAWAALLASGLLCTAATTLLWNWGLTQVPASQAGVLLNMEPLMGSLLGVLVLHETLGRQAWLGGAMIVTSAVTLTLQTHRAPAHEPV